jgi:hypothetical protein
VEVNGYENLNTVLTINGIDLLIKDLKIGNSWQIL